MKIAMLLSNAFRPDPRVLKEARSLAQAGHSVTVVCWDREAALPVHERIGGFDVIRIQVRSGYSAGSRQVLYLPRFWRQALGELGRLKPDVVHCHDLDTAPCGGWYARLHGKPWIFDAHECYPEEVRQQVHGAVYRLLVVLERIAVRQATRVITVGELLGDYLRGLGGLVSIVGNYQTLTAFETTSRVKRSELGLREDEFVIAYIGGFTEDRAIAPLVRATAVNPSVKVLLLGDGPQRERIEALLPAHPQVHYLGWKPQEMVPAYTALADAIYYGLNDANGNARFSAPNSLFNALAAGKPLLTTAIGEIAQIVKRERCGVVVERPDPAELTSGLALLQDPALRAEWGRNARAAAETRYNWTYAERALLDVYRSLER